MQFSAHSSHGTARLYAAKDLPVFRLLSMGMQDMQGDFPGKEAQ
jgi:hypothetical protein